jgi:alpha-methylacyl-CoA racemase
MLSISRYGQDGPLRDRAGHDLNYIALAGVLGLAGPPDRPPPTPPIQLADIAGGALFGAVGILAALYERERTERGQQVDLSMCEGALAFAIPELGNYDASGKPPRRGAELLIGGAACYGVYRTRDERFLSVGALEPKFWSTFNQAIGRPVDLSELIADEATQAKVRGEIQAILETKTRAEWEAILSGDVCVEPVLGADELQHHPQHRARAMFFELDGLMQTRTPFGGTAGHRPPPAHGGDRDTILREAGFSDGEIEQLKTSGATK